MSSRPECPYCGKYAGLTGCFGECVEQAKNALTREAFEELVAYMYVLERCDFDRGVTGALLENPVTLLENIKRCVASKCSTEMTRTILLEGLV